MTKTRFSRPRAWLLAAAWLLLCAPVGAWAGPGEGLRDLDGQAHSIDDYTGHGKWLVVMIWASDCSVCNADAHHYVDFYNAHHDKDISVLGVSMDGWAGRAAAKDFIRRHHVTFPNLVGEPTAVAQLFQNLTGQSWVGTPSFLIYDPSGTLRVQQAGAVPVDLIEQYIKTHSAGPGQARRPPSASDDLLAMR